MSAATRKPPEIQACRDPSEGPGTGGASNLELFGAFAKTGGDKIA